jgi:CubicO group peptidase (beta-lactamase class C family)
VIAYRNLDNIGPAGAINSNVLDMARWIRVQLAGGRVDGQPRGERLVDSASFREMYTPQMLIPMAEYYPAARLAKPHFTAYGLGWFLQDYHGHMVAMHTGSIDGMSAIIGLLPEQRLGVIVLANLDHAELRHALMYRVFDLYLKQPERDWSADVRVVYRKLEAEAKEAEKRQEAQRVTGTRPSLPLEAYAGRYVDSLYGNTQVRLERGALVTSLGPGFVGDLEHWHFETFRARWRDRALGTDLITFTLTPDGKVGTLAIKDIGDFERAPE